MRKLTLLVVLLLGLVVTMPVVNAELLSLTYDANGNLISGDGKFRVYDEFNRLVEVRNGSDSTGQLLEVSVWHPVQEKILFKDVYEAGVKKERVFYFNGFTRVENASGVFNTTEVMQEGVLVAENTPQGKRFISADPLGSSSLTTDAFGTPLENTTYDPYGGIIQGGSGRFDYEDKEFSSATGEYDFHFRKYNPTLKIFTQPDTLIQNSFDPQALNRYAFERNNPYRYDDETGHIWQAIVEAILTEILLIIGTVIASKQAYEKDSGIAAPDPAQPPRDGLWMEEAKPKKKPGQGTMEPASEEESKALRDAMRRDGLNPQNPGTGQRTTPGCGCSSSSGNGIFGGNSPHPPNNPWTTPSKSTTPTKPSDKPTYIAVKDNKGGYKVICSNCFSSSKKTTTKK